MRGTQAIKHNHANHPVRKSIRLVKAKKAKLNEREQREEQR